MTFEMRVVLGVIAAGAVIAAIYAAVLCRAIRHEGRRRRGGEARIAAQIYARGCWSRWGVTGRDADLSIDAGNYLRGIVDDHPVALPWVSSVMLAGTVLILMVDPVMDDPLLPWTQGLRWLPDWTKMIWLACALTIAIGLPVVMFFLPSRRISRQWLVLHRDGRISGLGGDLPELDPGRPFAAEYRLLAGGLSRWHAVLIVQGDNEVTILLSPDARFWNRWWPFVRQMVPPDACAVVLGAEVGKAVAHLEQHFLPGLSVATGRAAPSGQIKPPGSQ